MTKILTVTQYAKLHGISRPATLKRISTKKIESVRVGSFHLIIIGKLPQKLYQLLKQEPNNANI